jgi:hypothetical protein
MYLLRAFTLTTSWLPSQLFLARNISIGSLPLMAALTVIMIPYRRKGMAEELQPVQLMMALQTTRTVLSGTATHCLRSLAPDILTREPKFWLVSLKGCRRGGDEPALGAFVAVSFVPQMP